MLDPQEASHYMLDATPVNGRNRSEKPKPNPESIEQKPLTKNTLMPPPMEQQSRLGASPRRPRRFTSGNRADKPATSRAHAKTASTSAVEDPWMANGDSVVEARPINPVSPVKRPIHINPSFIIYRGADLAAASTSLTLGNGSSGIGFPGNFPRGSHPSVSSIIISCSMGTKLMTCWLYSSRMSTDGGLPCSQLRSWAAILTWVVALAYLYTGMACLFTGISHQ